jgi:hypothetical protein
MTPGRAIAPCCPQDAHAACTLSLLSFMQPRPGMDLAMREAHVGHMLALLTNTSNPALWTTLCKVATMFDARAQMEEYLVVADIRRGAAGGPKSRRMQALLASGGQSDELLQGVAEGGGARRLQTVQSGIAAAEPFGGREEQGRWMKQGFMEALLSCSGECSVASVPAADLMPNVCLTCSNSGHWSRCMHACMHANHWPWCAQPQRQACLA